MCDTDEALARLLQKEEDDSQAQVGVQYEADLALALQLQRQEEDEAAKRAQQHNHRQLEAPDLPPTKDATSITNTVTIVLSDDDEDNSKITESDVALAWQLHQMDHTKDQSADRALAWRIHNENFIAASQEHTCSPPNGEINLQDLINDPTPDIHALFVAFDQMYFDGSLAAVELQWSTRMTLCAGLCYYKGPGTCLIRLSEPLLKYRSREDMINTLLHEMIHAFLFLLHGPRFADHDGHGPEFLKEAARINRRAGTNITIYHNFHDEVDHYRQHVWQCDGPCREKPPFFGIVKRSMNRAPQPADLWWHDHQLTCGGKFHKVSEPENVTKKKKKKKSHKITEFFDCGEASGSSSSQKRKRTDE